MGVPPSKIPLNTVIIGPAMMFRADNAFFFAIPKVYVSYTFYVKTYMFPPLNFYTQKSSFEHPLSEK